MLAPNPTVQHLQAARNLIASPERWCQGDYAKDGRYCALGALFKAAQERCEQFLPSRLFLDQAAFELYRGGPMMVNDQLGHEAILRCFERAIELAATGEP